MSELPGTVLTDADLEVLKLSWIDQESAEGALLRRVTSIEGAELIGQHDGKDYAGIVFSNLWPGDPRPREFRLRRDSPDVTYEKGVRKDVRRYLSPPGRGNLLYFASALARNDPTLLAKGDPPPQLGGRLLPQGKSTFCRTANAVGAGLAVAGRSVVSPATPAT